MEVQKSVPLTFGEKWAFSKLGNTWTTLSLALVVQRMVQLMHSINASTPANIYRLKLFFWQQWKTLFLIHSLQCILSKNFLKGSNEYEGEK